jgi:hypothetical protein
VYKLVVFSLLFLCACSQEQMKVEYLSTCTNLRIINNKDSISESYQSKLYLAERQNRRKYTVFNDRKEFMSDLFIVGGDSFKQPIVINIDNFDTMSISGRFLHFNDSFYYRTRQIYRREKVIKYDSCFCIKN